MVTIFYLLSLLNVEPSYFVVNVEARQQVWLKIDGIPIQQGEKYTTFVSGEKLLEIKYVNGNKIKIERIVFMTFPHKRTTITVKIMAMPQVISVKSPKIENVLAMK